MYYSYVFICFNDRIFGEGKVPPASKKVLEELPTSLIGPTEAGIVSGKRVGKINLSCMEQMIVPYRFHTRFWRL